METSCIIEIPIRLANVTRNCIRLISEHYQKPVDQRKVPLSKNVEAWQELVDVKQRLLDKLIASSQKHYCPKDQECEDVIHEVIDLFIKSNVLAAQLQETNSTESNTTEVSCGLEQEQQPSDYKQEPESLRVIKQKVEELDKQFRALLDRRINDELKRLQENARNLAFSLENKNRLLEASKETLRRSALESNPEPDPNFLVDFEMNHLEEQRFSLLSQLVEKQHANLTKLVQKCKQLKDL